MSKHLNILANISKRMKKIHCDYILRHGTQIVFAQGQCIKLFNQRNVLKEF